MRFSFGSEPHLLRVAFGKSAFPEALSILGKQCWGLSCPLNGGFSLLGVYHSLQVLLPSGGVLSSLPSAVQLWNNFTEMAPNCSQLTFPFTFTFLQLPAVISSLGFISYWVEFALASSSHKPENEHVWRRACLGKGLTRPCCTALDKR